MTENMKKFLEEVSKDEKLAEKVCSEKDKYAFIAIAKDMGITLTESDLEEENEISDDELDAVTGGGKCACAFAGGGTGDGYNAPCACVAGGIGKSGDYTTRCYCLVGGGGKPSNE